MTGLLSPLSPATTAMLNRTPVTASFEDRLKSSAPPVSTYNNIDDDDLVDAPPTSPFQPDVDENQHQSATDAADMTPSKFYTAKQSRRSPVKMFDIHCDDLEPSNYGAPEKHVEQDEFKMPEVPSQRHSEDTVTALDMSEVGPAPVSRVEEVDDFDDDLSMCDAPTVVSDDTCFSTFSAVPNADMTMFANLGNRTQNNISGDITPRGPSSRTPATKRKHSETPSTRPAVERQRPKSGDNDTTSLLLDFTQQFENGPRVSPSKSSAAPNLLSYINHQRSPGKTKAVTPAKRASVMNLLDFDLPPQPTPRSMPTITARELESLKSSYLSEISSLKASLSGREAEVESLKKAVSDAERRVGEALETVRSERSAKEHAERGKQEWEKKGREVETVMKSLKEAFQELEKEREELLQKLEDGTGQLRQATSAKDAAETRSLELAARLANSSKSGESPDAAGEAAVESLITQRVNAQLDERTASISLDLHAIYKKKHETKVATLKKTYESRYEKKTAELQQKVEQLTKQNEELTAQQTSSASPDTTALTNEISAQKAEISTLHSQLTTLTTSHTALLADLERERLEKGDLVAAVDEMLALQADTTAAAAVGQTPARASSVISGIEDFRRSLSRPAGVSPAPLSSAGFGAAGGGRGESRIGRFGVPRIGGGAASGAGGGVGKSKMMSNIERMGGGGRNGASIE